MNRSTFALFVALLIHIVILLLFWLLGTLSPELSKPKEHEKKLKISLKELPKKYKESGLTKEQITPPPEMAPPMPKGSQLKKIVQQPPVKYEPKKQPKKPKLNKSKRVKPTSKAKVQTSKKPFIPLLTNNEPSKPTPKDKNPMAWLNEDKSAQESQKESSKSLDGSNVSSDVKELYGDEFGKLSPGQQKYILDNQEIMRRITQQVLNRVARVNLDRNLNVNRSNVIEFYLHPNGDMSDFRFLSKSGYYTLDDITKETIEYAYSKYPRPTEKTLIRYNVYYNLARY